MEWPDPGSDQARVGLLEALSSDLRAQRADRERGGGLVTSAASLIESPAAKRPRAAAKRPAVGAGGPGGSAPRLEQEQIAAHTVSVEDRARMIECGLGARERPTTTSTAAFAEATIFPFLRDACVAPKNLISTYLGMYLVWRSLGSRFLARTSNQGAAAWVERGRRKPRPPPHPAARREPALALSCSSCRRRAELARAPLGGSRAGGHCSARRISAAL